MNRPLEVKKLTPDQRRRIIHLLKQEGITMTVIAQRVGCSPSCVGYVNREEGRIRRLGYSDP